MRASWNRRSSRPGLEPPIELRFVDLFMILMTTLIFIAVILSIISAAIPPGPGRYGKDKPVAVERPPVPPPVIRQPLRVKAASIALPKATFLSAYKVLLQAEGGSPPYRWRLVKGELPPGLKWSAQGVLQGRPRGSGETFTFSMEAADAANRRLSQEFVVIVNPARWQVGLVWLVFGSFILFGGQGLLPFLKAFWDRRRYR